MEHACSPLWRLTGDSLARQNSRAFHASVECGMRNVDKNTRPDDNKAMCSERKRMKWHFEVPFELILDQFLVHQNAQIIAFLVIRASVHCSFACYHHPVSCTDTSACYLNLVTLLCSTCTSPLKQGWHYAILSLPNEDFGRMNKRRNPDVRSTFQGREYSNWATNR